MKQIIYIFIAILFFNISLSAKENQEIKRIIKNPYYEFKSPGIFEVPEIIVTDRDIRIKLKAYAMPNWWIKVDEDAFIRDSNNKDGNKYKLISAEGIEIGKEVDSPRSGVCEYTLIFEPMKNNVSSIYFEEGNWKIEALDITGNKKFLKYSIPESYHGEWVENENQFTYHISDSNIIENNNVWEYDYIRNNGKSIEVGLKNDTDRKTLFFKKNRKGIVSIKDKQSNKVLMIEKRNI